MQKNNKQNKASAKNFVLYFCIRKKGTANVTIFYSECEPVDCWIADFAGLNALSKQEQGWRFFRFRLNNTFKMASILYHCPTF